MNAPTTLVSTSKRTFTMSATLANATVVVATLLGVSLSGPFALSSAYAADTKAGATAPAETEAPAKAKKDVESPATVTKTTKSDPKKAGAKKMTSIVIETSLGNIEAELNDEKAPKTVENFKHYIAKKHYDGLIFHRVIKDFMIQGGGMNEKMEEKKNDAPIKNEATNGLKNDRGTLAMARTSVVDSATSQFFINTVDNDFLNHKTPDPRGYGYAVFGKVTSGMDVVDKIRAVPTGSSMGMSDVPKTPVVIKTIRLK